MNPILASRAKEIAVKFYDANKNECRGDAGYLFDKWAQTSEAAALLSGEDWKEDGEEKDHFAIAFAVWALHDPQAQSYIASGVTAYKLLELYKDRPYINTYPKIN